MSIPYIWAFISIYSHMQGWFCPPSPLFPCRSTGVAPGCTGHDEGKTNHPCFPPIKFLLIMLYSGHILVVDLYWLSIFSSWILKGQMSLMCPTLVLKEEVLFRIIPHFGQKAEVFPPIRTYNEDIYPLKHKLTRPKYLSKLLSVLSP